MPKQLITSTFLGLYILASPKKRSAKSSNSSTTTRVSMPNIKTDANGKKVCFNLLKFLLWAVVDKYVFNF